MFPYINILKKLLKRINPKYKAFLQASDHHKKVKKANDAMHRVKAKNLYTFECLLY